MFKVIVLSVFSLILLTGCNHFDASLLIQPNSHHVDRHQPPAHAPAHGRRAQHRYHYYPEADFYYDDNRNTYFFIDSSGGWKVSVNLPHRYHTYLRTSYVEIDMESDRPYVEYKDHKRKYNKNKNKNKKKHKGKGHGNKGNKHHEG